jgi:UDP-glucose 6-dehydrogenase
MKLGIIGVGVVGGSLKKWFENHSEHELRCYDPAKGFNHSFDGVEAVFISVPVPATPITEMHPGGQDLSILVSSVALAKKYTENVFIRSSVLPGTSDALNCVACPEFLTARRAYEDMETLPLLAGNVDPAFISKIFPGKTIYTMSNIEAEMSKFTHNCFGAFKVLYFNIVNELAEKVGANYQNILFGAGITGFIEPEHTKVPGPDGKYGYGGTCFPENIAAMKEFLNIVGMYKEANLFNGVQDINRGYRVGKKIV